MMNLKRWWKSLFPDPLATLREARPQLEEFADRLSPIYCRLQYRQGDAFTEIAGFCQIVTDFQDKGVVKQCITAISRHNRDGQFNVLLSDLDLLSGHIATIGRKADGLNRTPSGHRVTDDTIYLRHPDGQFTTVADIKRCLDTACYRTMGQHANNLIREHALRMIHIIGQLPARSRTRAA